MRVAAFRQDSDSAELRIAYRTTPDGVFPLQETTAEPLADVNVLMPPPREVLIIDEVCIMARDTNLPSPMLIPQLPLFVFITLPQVPMPFLSDSVKLAGVTSIEASAASVVTCHATNADSGHKERNHSNTAYGCHFRTSTFHF